MDILGFHIGRRAPAHHPAPPRFYAATKAEQRKADAASTETRGRLERTQVALTPEQRKALIDRALTVQFDKHQGRAGA